MEETADSIDKDCGKRVLVPIFLGAGLITLAVMSPIILVLPGLTPDNWFLRIGSFVAVLWFGLSAGLAIILWRFFSRGFTRRIAVLICIGVGFCISFYPGGFQLIVGESTVSGTLAEVGRSEANDYFQVNPESKTVTKQRVRKFDEIRIKTDSGEIVRVSLLRIHAEKVIEAAGGEYSRRGKVTIRYLKYSRRLLEVSAANP